MATTTAKTSASLLFIGDGARCEKNVTARMRRPEIREALGGVTVKGMAAESSKRVTAMERVCSNLNNFFNVALATKGSRTTANNNAIGD